MASGLLGGDLTVFHRSGLAGLRDRIVPSAWKAATALEAGRDLVVPSGDYWNAPEKLDAEALSAIDGLWLEALPAAPDKDRVPASLFAS